MSSTAARRPPGIPYGADGAVPGMLDRATVERRLLERLTFVVPKDKPPVGYAVAMTVLAGCLVLMPAAYAALVAFLGWLAGWHAVQAVRSLSYGPYFLFHVPMAIAGAVLVLFLIKPVFYRPKGKGIGVLTLTPQEQPLLFAAVGRLCAATGARPPSSIEVDCEPNAHARFRRFTDSIGGGELVLRVGLPLAAGLSARQLLGVIGHELGHFNQRRGMAGSYLIRRLNGFLARAVFHRDRVDESLARLRRRPQGAARLVYHVAVALVEPMRGVLWLMMVCGELLTCSVQRRMEHDADDVEAHVAGAADFVRTAKLLLFLGVAHRRAVADLAAAYNHQRLADDLPRLIVVNAKQLREHRAELLALLDGVRTRWFDTHPCHADRVAHVERSNAAGLFDCDLPASTLFNDFRGLCRRATDDFYRGILKPDDLAGAKVVSTDVLAAERADQRAAAKVLRRYFRGHVVAGRPMFPLAQKIEVPVADVSKAAARLAEARQSVEDAGRAGTALASTIRRYAEASVLVPMAQAQLTLARLFSHSPRSTGLARRADRLLAQHRPALAETTAILRSFEQTGRQRLTLALRLMRHDAVATGLGEGIAAARAKVSQLSGVCLALDAALPAATRLAELLPALRLFSAAYNPKQPFQPLVRQILASTAEVVKQLKEVEALLSVVPYPFAHGTAGVTVGAHVVRRLPDPKDPQAVIAAASAALDRYHELTFRALSVLTHWAERAEIAAGLPALGEVEESTDAKAVDETPFASITARRSRRYWIGYGMRAVAGLTMVAVLVGVSISPPALPLRPWGDRSNVDYRPAAFDVTAPLQARVRTPFIPVARPPSWPPEFGNYQGRPIVMPHIDMPRLEPQSYGPSTFVAPVVPPTVPAAGLPPHFIDPPNFPSIQPRSFAPPAGFGGHRADSPARGRR